MKLSVCIPTHERHALLEQRCLPSLLRQTRLPDEVIVADSSTSAGVSEFYQKWARRFEPIPFIYVQTQGRPSVVTNRWQAFCRSSGDLVLYVDDDIQFTAEAFAELHSTFSIYPDAAGVGMKYYFEGPPSRSTLRRRFEDWWTGDTQGEPYAITPGGRRTSGEKRVDAKPIVVQWLPGGTMCCRREALAPVGPLPGLDSLFKLRISASADIVLSHQLNRWGPLMLLTQPLAWHPDHRIALKTATSWDGWRCGLRETFGRAHILRWLAQDKSSVMHEWVLSITLDCLKAIYAVSRRPLAAPSWLRLFGFLYGGLLTLATWRRIPNTPNEPIAVSRRWLFL